MAKLNLTLHVSEEEKASVLEGIQSYIFSYNMLYAKSKSEKLNPLRSELCDNNDGTFDLRIIDFEFDMDALIYEIMEESKSLMSSLGIDINSLFS